jgi:ParB-like chromosome segregation protein Spo0J
MAKIKNIIGNLIEIDWLNNLNDLQPDNVKLPYNYGALKQSILKYGFAVPFAVWNNKGKYYAIDGHTRKLILTEIKSEGIEVPTLLKAYEIEAKNKQEAIKILVDFDNHCPHLS